MLGWLFRKDPRSRLQSRYEALMREARDLQRRGDIVAYSAKVAEADAAARALEAFDRAAARAPGA